MNTVSRQHLQRISLSKVGTIHIPVKVGQSSEPMGMLDDADCFDLILAHIILQLSSQHSGLI
jgi:hypothetical protein